MASPQSTRPQATLPFALLGGLSLTAWFLVAMALPQHPLGGWLLRRNTALGVGLLSLAGFALDTARKSYSAIDLPAVVGCYAAIHEAIHVADVATRKRKVLQDQQSASATEPCEEPCVM